MKTLLKMLAMYAVVTSLSAFTTTRGGEGFEIFLNSRPLVQKFGGDLNDIKTIRLEKLQSKDRLTVKYYHCGRSGKNRVVQLRDAQDKTLKTFHYPDTASLTAMEVPLNDLFGMKNSYLVKVFYSSSELPKGRTLALLQL